MQLTNCFLERIKGWQAHHPLWESIPLDNCQGLKRNTCSNLQRCGLDDIEWQYLDTRVLGWIYSGIGINLPLGHRQCGRTCRDVRQLVSVGGFSSIAVTLYLVYVFTRRSSVLVQIRNKNNTINSKITWLQITYKISNHRDIGLNATCAKMSEKWTRYRSGAADLFWVEST